MVRNYYLKAIKQMVLEENYTDRATIAEELGITKSTLSTIIRNMPYELKMEIQEKLEKRHK